MARNIKGNPSTSEYWTRRVNSIKDKKDVLFLDPRREEYWKRVREQLSLWKKHRVLDVCCGYGQFADIFVDYEGVDFCPEMIEMAYKEYPNKRWLVGDIKSEEFDDQYDIIFEVNSLHSLGWTPDDFFNKFKSHAKVIACLEADKFTIYNGY